MSAPGARLDPDRASARAGHDALAELLVTAATALAEQAAPSDVTYSPLGIPCKDGRINLGRLREHVCPEGQATVTLLAQFAGVVWVGQSTDTPLLTQLVLPFTSRFDFRQRLMIPRTARLRLVVADLDNFDVAPVAARSGGLFLVPVQDFVRRMQGVAHVAL